MLRTFRPGVSIIPKAVSVSGAAIDTSLDGVPMQQTHAMDSTIAMDAGTTLKQFNGQTYAPLGATTFAWYASQGFIGYQACAIISQHWFVAKACLMPAMDAVRNGFEITNNDGSDIDPMLLDAIRNADQKYNLVKNLVQYVQMGRVFGIRCAIFLVQSTDPDYYKKPFNIDSVKPGSYMGITQIDPYWITPLLDSSAASNPLSPNFYEPTWWNVNGVMIHRTHMVIFRTEELPDILKTNYLYGAVSIPQKIYERVYAAERVANEAPMLCLTKRTDVIKVDDAAATMKEKGLRRKLETWRATRDNYGVKVLGHKDDYLHAETSLAELDAVIMTSYQLACAAVRVPSTKMMGTAPKGFNATGEFDEASYHEDLSSLQAHDLTPLIQRHHQLLIKSDIAPNAPFETCIKWNPLDEPTAEEVANVNKIKADTGAVLVQSGAIDGQDERDRIIKDNSSGYDGLSAIAPEPEDETEDDETMNESEESTANTK